MKGRLRETKENGTETATKQKESETKGKQEGGKREKGRLKVMIDERHE